MLNLNHELVRVLFCLHPLVRQRYRMFLQLNHCKIQVLYRSVSSQLIWSMSHIDLVHSTNIFDTNLSMDNNHMTWSAHWILGSPCWSNISSCLRFDWYNIDSHLEHIQLKNIHKIHSFIVHLIFIFSRLTLIDSTQQIHWCLVYTNV